MSTSDPFDIAIIGAGIVGASIAYFTSERRRVLILEGEQAPGYHTTGRSAALFTETYGPHNVRALSRASRSFFDNPPLAFASSPLLKARGTLFPGSEDDRGHVEKLHREMLADGGRPQLLDTEAALRMVPVLRPEAAALAVFDAAAFDIDVDALLQGFLKGARAHGAQLVTRARVQSLQRQGGCWQIDVAQGTRFNATTVVNAAGAWADQLAMLAATRGIGIVPKRRSAFLFAAPQGLESARWPAVIAADESWYFKPDAGLLLGSPANADPVSPHDVVAEDMDVMMGIHQIEQATTLSIGRPKSTWAGLRCFVSDGEPVCGFATDISDFFWAAALGGYGIQTSPAFGQLAAALILGTDVPEHIAAQGLNLDALAPDRPRLQSPET